MWPNPERNHQQFGKLVVDSTQAVHIRVLKYTIQGIKNTVKPLGQRSPHTHFVPAIIWVVLKFNNFCVFCSCVQKMCIMSIMNAILDFISLHHCFKCNIESHNNRVRISQSPSRYWPFEELTKITKFWRNSAVTGNYYNTDFKPNVGEQHKNSLSFNLLIPLFVDFCKCIEMCCNSLKT